MKTTKRKVNKREILDDGTVINIVEEESFIIPIEDFDFSLLGLSNDFMKQDDNSKK